MAGIVVGMDGSLHARNALEWAMREAAMRHVALTALAVNPVMASPWTGHPQFLPNDTQVEERMREAAQEVVAKSASELGEARPASVTVTVLSGFPARALIEASRDADLIVIGSRGAGGFQALRLGSIGGQVVHHAACPVVVVPSGPRGG